MSRYVLTDKHTGRIVAEFPDLSPVFALYSVAATAVIVFLALN